MNLKKCQHFTFANVLDGVKNDINFGIRGLELGQALAIIKAYKSIQCEYNIY